MAILTVVELQMIRNNCSAKIIVPCTKAQINAAAQAVEDLITNNATAISNAIDAATSPVVLSNALKKKLVAEVLDAKFRRDG